VSVDIATSSDDEYEVPQSTFVTNRTLPAAAGIQLNSGATAKIGRLCGDILKDAINDTSDSQEDDGADSSDSEYEVPAEQISDQQLLESTRQRQWKMHQDVGVDGVWTDGATKRPYRLVVNIYKLPYYHVFGAYHTGVEIEGVEHAFRAGEHEGSGVFECSPCKARGYEYKESVSMGVAEVSPQQLDAVLRDLRLRFRAREYSLTLRNCNHYSDALCSNLVGRPIPSSLNRLASIGATFTSSSGNGSLQQREKDHINWCERQHRDEIEEKEFSAAGLRSRMNGTASSSAGAKIRSRMRVSALYMRGVVERRFESYAELDGSRKVVELRRLPDFELIKVTRVVPPVTVCARSWEE